MNIKLKILFDVILLILGICVFIYNFYYQREIVYISSVIVLLMLIVNLIRDILKLKNED